MKVKVRNGRVDAALRVFKRKSSEVIWEVRERQYYVPKSEQRRAARKAAITRRKRNERK